MAKANDFKKELTPINDLLQKLIDKYEIKSGIDILVINGKVYTSINLKSFITDSNTHLKK